MKFVLQNDLAELDRLAEQLERFGEEHELPQRTLLQLNLALDELVTNTITHGFTDGSDQRIEIEITSDGRAIDVILNDNGTAFDPFDAPAPDITAALEDRPIGGLGVFLVTQVMDAMEYSCRDGRNHIHLRKHLLPAGGGE